MISRSWQLIIHVILLALVLNSCSKNDGSQIYGHWRAERLEVHSIKLPIGYDFVVSRESVTSLEGGVSFPISSITAQDNVVVLDVPMGIGLSFYFVGADRMYFDVPFVGPIYFNRVRDVAPPTAVQPAALAVPTVSVQPPNPLPYSSVEAPHSKTIATAPRPMEDRISLADWLRDAESQIKAGNFDEAESLLIQAKRQFEDAPLLEFNLAVLRVHQGDQDMAIRHLADAFRHGFRAYGLLENSKALASLKSDPRYEALLARYR